MRMPPRGQRYIAANWIAVGLVASIAASGSSLLLTVRDQLPREVVVHWSGGQPDITVPLSSMLLFTGVASLSLCLLIQTAGRVAAGSWRHTWAGASLAAGAGVGLSLYGAVWEQRDGWLAEPSASMLSGWALGFLGGTVLRSWARATPARRSATAVPREPVPPTVRVAWVGAARVPWSARIGSALFAALWVLFLAWWSDAGTVLLLMGGAAVGLIAAMMRTREVVVDYSGVGLRAGSWTPSAIKIADIRAVEVASVKGMRDFGGWGYQVAADGTEGWITRSGDALVVHRWSEPDFVFTVDDAAGAAGVLRLFLSPSEVA